MNDIYSLSDTQIQKQIGSRIKETRLKQNITQDSLAEAASISRSSIQKIESGEIGAFESLIRILRTLGMLNEFQHFCQEQQLSPIEYYEMVNSAKKKTRKRACSKVYKDKEETLEW